MRICWFAFCSLCVAFTCFSDTLQYCPEKVGACAERHCCREPGWSSLPPLTLLPILPKASNTDRHTHTHNECVTSSLNSIFQFVLSAWHKRTTKNKPLLTKNSIFLWSFHVKFPQKSVDIILASLKQGLWVILCSTTPCKNENHHPTQSHFVEWLRLFRVEGVLNPTQWKIIRITKNSGMKLYRRGMIEETALSNVTCPHLDFSAERLCYSAWGSMATNQKTKTQFLLLKLFWEPTTHWFKRIPGYVLEYFCCFYKTFNTHFEHSEWLLSWLMTTRDANIHFVGLLPCISCQG